MSPLYVIFTAFGSVIVLFLLTKLLGYREISELSMFDYINGITIGSIAAEMATDLEEFEKPLIAMVVYTIAIFSISELTQKSIKLRRFFAGTPLVLMDNGTVYYKNLRKAKMDLGELMVQCRNNGYFDISQIQTIILECNGKVSILPVATQRPVTPNDLNLNPQAEGIVANVVIDGKIMYKNLKHTGNDEKWLNNQLNSHGVKNVTDVLLATCDIHNKVTVYAKLPKADSKDVLE